MGSVRAIPLTVVAAVGLGIVLGSAAWFSDQLAWPLQLLVPANAIGAWLGVAFVAGATGRTVPLGALRGLLALAAAVAAYYLLIRLTGEGIRAVGAGHAATVWGVVAMITGPVMGAAGATWRHGRGWPRAVSVSLLAAALVAESVGLGAPYLLAKGLAVDPSTIFIAAMALLGLLLPALLLGRGERLRGYVSLGAIAAAALLAIRPTFDLVREFADRF
ncbi:MAG TPA: DUF6518 family protein [Patescibacteria group bacterium]|nr:DUF6518 family protein [Patescibacteria group bacterium]